MKMRRTWHRTQVRYEADIPKPGYGDDPEECSSTRAQEKGEKGRHGNVESEHGRADITAMRARDVIGKDKRGRKRRGEADAFDAVPAGAHESRLFPDLVEYTTATGRIGEQASMDRGCADERVGSISSTFRGPPRGG
jgi:hypothetical protein